MLSANSQDIGSDSLEETFKYQPIPLEQADSMGILLVQTYDGRIEPTHTLAYDIFHKISNKFFMVNFFYNIGISVILITY